MTDGRRLHVPPNDKPHGDHRFTLFTIADDIVGCRARDPPQARTARRISALAHARLITNVRITGVDGDTISIAANFVVYRHRRGEPVREFVGHYRTSCAGSAAC